MGKLPSLMISLTGKSENCPFSKLQGNILQYELLNGDIVILLRRGWREGWQWQFHHYGANSGSAIGIKGHTPLSYQSDFSLLRLTSSNEASNLNIFYKARRNSQENSKLSSWRRANQSIDARYCLELFSELFSPTPPRTNPNRQIPRPRDGED